MADRSRVLVLGASGMLGSMCAAVLRDRGFETLTPRSSALDITDTVTLRRYAIEHRISAVLNCAVAKDFGDIERWPHGFAVNTTGPLMLAQLAAEMGIALFHISTDAVFEGRGEASDETSEPAPLTPYARSKLAGEPTDALVLRGSFIGPGKTAAPSLIEKLTGGGDVTASPGELWNGLTTLEAAEIIAGCLASGRKVTGVRHIFGPDLDKLTLARSVKQVCSLSGSLTTTDRVRDLRLRTIHSDVQPAPVTDALPPRLDRLRETAKRFGLWP